MTGTKTKVSWRETFGKFNVLLLASEHLLPVLSFVVGNVEKF
jgi:hypothetical protein